MRTSEDPARHRGLRAALRARRGRVLLGVAAVAAAAALAGGAALVGPAWTLSSRFDTLEAPQPSRLYARGTVLRRGDGADAAELVAALEAAGYHRASGSAVAEGRYRSSRSRVEAFLRRTPEPGGWVAPRRLRVDLDGGRIVRLAVDGRDTGSCPLEPPLLASFYGPGREERRPVRVADLPLHVVRAVLAAEDDGFFSHPGVSLTGTLRAAWVDLRGARIAQGGSTLTQQLVKNLYLDGERTLSRKVREAAIAMVLEARYSKEQILQAYLNEIYLGADDGVSVMGLGAASRFFFGKDAEQLSLAEAATLAGMISSPARFSPLSHPDAARARRDRVLGRMESLGWITPAEREEASSGPVETAPDPLPGQRAPYFAEAARREAAARFGVDALDDRGAALLSTLGWHDQAAAEGAVQRGLAALERGAEGRRRRGGPLQAALVSVDPATGGILAYVGGRDWTSSQFDRAGSAARQAGSAFKPVVYAAAMSEGLVSPATLVDDEPLTVALAGGTWTPEDDDGKTLGRITVRTALERSRNLPTVRVALQAGLPAIADLAFRLGVAPRPDPVPALALGAAEVSPVEMATVYAALAAGGVRPPVHALEAVLGAGGPPVAGEPLPAPERVLDPRVAYLVTSLLQGVLDRGTGAAARAYGVTGALAGKTGTTNERRDNWFCGYAPERATAVWVGYDDDAPTRLSGARAALPIWSAFTVAVRPPGGWAAFARPAGIVEAVIDADTGELATERCPHTLTESFLEEHAPTELCREHRGFLVAPAAQPEVKVKQPGRFRRWLMKIFGRKKHDG